MSKFEERNMVDASLERELSFAKPTVFSTENFLKVQKRNTLEHH